MTPHCGRLDAHEPHEWIGTHSWVYPIVYACPGVIVTEGAAMPLCTDCGEQPAAAHGWGKCRWCWAEREVAANA